MELVLIIFSVLSILFLLFGVALLIKQNNSFNKLSGGTDTVCTATTIEPFMICHPATNSCILEIWRKLIDTDDELNSVIKTIMANRIHNLPSDSHLSNYMNEYTDKMTLPFLIENIDNPKFRDEDIVLIMVISIIFKLDFTNMSIKKYFSMRSSLEMSLDHEIYNARHKIDNYFNTNIFKNISFIDLVFIETDYNNNLNTENLNKCNNKMNWFKYIYTNFILNHSPISKSNTIETIDLYFLYEECIDINEYENTFRNIFMINESPTYSCSDGKYFIKREGNIITYTKCSEGDGMFFIKTGKHGEKHTQFLSIGVDEYKNKHCQVIEKERKYTFSKYNTHIIKSICESLSYISCIKTNIKIQFWKNYIVDDTEKYKLTFSVRFPSVQFIYIGTDKIK